MSVSSISPYSSMLGESNSSSKSSSSGLDMTDFLTLMSAQFQNQDISNPTSNTEFITELAQFSAIQAMSSLAQASDKQYAASLVGKTVMVQSEDSTGTTKMDQGVVECASFSSSGNTVVVNGKAYDVDDVTEVVDASGSV